MEEDRMKTTTTEPPLNTMLKMDTEGLKSAFVDVDPIEVSDTVGGSLALDRVLLEHKAQATDTSTDITIKNTGEIK